MRATRDPITLERPGPAFDRAAFADRIASLVADAVLGEVNRLRVASGRAPLR